MITKIKEILRGLVIVDEDSNTGSGPYGPGISSSGYGLACIYCSWTSKSYDEEPSHDPSCMILEGQSLLTILENIELVDGFTVAMEMRDPDDPYITVYRSEYHGTLLDKAIYEGPVIPVSLISRSLLQ